MTASPSTTPDQSADSAAKAWLRALELTAPIARHPDRIFPTVIEELAREFGDAPALLSDRECLTYRALAERSNQYARWALDQGLGKGDAVVPVHAEPARIHGHLARHHPGRRRGRAAQHQSDRPLARALHRYRRAQTSHCGRGLIDPMTARCRSFRAGDDLGPRRRATAVPRIDRDIERHSGDTLAAANAGR